MVDVLKLAKAAFVRSGSASKLVGGARNSKFAQIGGRTMLGEKLRRAASAASTLANPHLLPPLIVPAAWTTGEVVTTGVVRVSAGNWYVSGGAGTCGATAPTNTVSGNTISDGGVSWEYIGGPLSTANDPDAPTVTVITGSSAPSGYVQVVDPVNNPGLFKITGGYPISVGDVTYQRYTTFTRKPAATPTGHHIAYEITTDAPGVVIRMQTGQTPLRIEVDGRFVYAGNTAQNNASKQLVQIEMPSGRKRRTWRVHGSGADHIVGGVILKALDMVYAPTALDPIRALMIGDSTWEGTSYGPFRSGGSEFRQVARAVGWNDPWSMSIGGTGVIDVNEAGGTFYTFGQRVPEALTRNPDIWCFNASINDRPGKTVLGTLITTASLTAAVSQLLRDVRAGSSAPIFVLGTWPVNDSGQPAGSKNTDIEAAWQAGIAASGASNVFFIPMAGAVPPWVIGTWNNGFNTSAANNPLMIGGDAIHPVEYGIREVAARASAEIFSILHTQL